MNLPLETADRHLVEQTEAQSAASHARRFDRDRGRWSPEPEAVGSSSQPGAARDVCDEHSSLHPATDELHRLFFCHEEQCPDEMVNEGLTVGFQRLLLVG
jgi:hypothetical protein